MLVRLLCIRRKGWEYLKKVPETFEWILKAIMYGVFLTYYLVLEYN